MCDRDCFHCQLPDCEEDGVTEEEIKASAKRDVEILRNVRNDKKAAYMKAYHEAHKDREKALHKRKLATDPMYREKKRAISRKSEAKYYKLHREEILAKRRAKRAEQKASIDFTRGKRELKHYDKT